MRLFTFSFVAVVWLISTASFSQSAKIDSLLLKLEQAPQNEDRIKITLALSSKLINADLFKALEYSDEAIKLASRLHYDSLEMAAYLNQANIYLQLGNYPRALQLYQEVIQRAERKSDNYMLAAAQGNIGIVHYYRRDFENALEYYLRALKYFSTDSLNVDRVKGIRKANLMNNTGIVYEETKRYDEATRYYVAALDLAEKLKENELMANVLNNFGTLYRDQGNADLALEYYERAMAIRQNINNKLGIARSSHNLGTFYFEFIKDNKKAEGYFQKAIALGTEMGAWQTVGSASNLLHQLYQQQGDYKRAYESLELSRQVNDSLFNAESTRKMAQLEMQFEFDRKQSLQAAEQKEKELYYLMSGGGLVLLLVIVTLLFFLQRSKTKRSQLEQSHLELEKVALKNDLVMKDKELATNIMYLLNKNELINSISEKLLEIKQQVNPESQSAVQKVVLDLQSNLQPELWQEFEFRFQQVHEKFYKTLNEKFPDLSPSDRRLCAFLKLDMSTKEISAITHQNAKSIDVARTRLRKKLNLTGTDHNLVTFLAQLDKETVD
ncbi:MAG: tetratricopeptide repeat protein [Cyclobacteriaceae bacterium]|nr:tetratricopeptide repeat protein [Cyclobacteriaceae bacterium]